MKIKKLILISFAAINLAGCSFTSQKTETSQVNNLVSYYETLKLKRDVESSFNQKVLQKKGYPNGYDLVLNRSKKEIALTIRPYSKKNFNYLKGDLQHDMEKVLKVKKYNDYHAKVLAYWRHGNPLKRQEQEEKILQDVANEMKKRHQIEVLPGTECSATDGRMISVTAVFMQNNKEISNPVDINNYHKEFVNLAQEKGLNISNLPMYFTYDLNRKITRHWMEKVVPSINEGLKEIKRLHVTSTTIIDERHPIIINTTINSSDSKSKENGKLIDKLVNEFFQNPDINKEFPGPYEIIVQSKDNMKIN
ncbi:hypothetical protein ACFVR2_17480 [Gottfriedia sp. NPDC057991]|uniref:hypothetical protein n=1 Tax=Gottfriedia sp. NPDC057991 TaxID=3346298 RepID=UPI0036D8C7A6